MKKSLYLIIVTVFLIFTSCKSGITGGESYNDARKEAGLPILPKDWIYGKEAGNMRHWFKQYGVIPPFTFHQKWLQVEGNRVVKEENLFKGGRYANGKDSSDQELRVGAYFDEGKNVIRWDIDYKGPGHDLLRLTKPQADSILREWGIKY